MVDSNPAGLLCACPSLPEQALAQGLAQQHGLDCQQVAVRIVLPVLQQHQPPRESLESAPATELAALIEATTVRCAARCCCRLVSACTFGQVMQLVCGGRCPPNAAVAAPLCDASEAARQKDRSGCTGKLPRCPQRRQPDLSPAAPWLPACREMLAAISLQDATMDLLLSYTASTDPLPPALEAHTFLMVPLGVGEA